MGKKSRTKAKPNSNNAGHQLQQEDPNPQKVAAEMGIGSGVELDGGFEGEEMDPFTEAMRWASLPALPMAMQTAIDLGLFDLLASVGPASLPSSDIAARLGCRQPEGIEMVDRLIGVLAFHNVLACSAQGGYHLTPAAKYFAKNEDGVSLAPLLRLNQDRVFLESWSGVKDAILKGGNPFNRAHGAANVFEYLSSKDGGFGQVYNTAMFNHTTIVVKEILESYDGFDNIKTLVDVGGGIGVALSLITAKHPSIKGINFDLPHVIHNAPPFPGVKHVAGDMFQSVPKGDAIFLKGILRDWDDDRCLKLLKNCCNALPKHGKVIVVEQVLPLIGDAVYAMREKLLNDVLSMALNPGGKERNQTELAELASAAGFPSLVFRCLFPQYAVMEFSKSLGPKVWSMSRDFLDDDLTINAWELF